MDFIGYSKLLNLVACCCECAGLAEERERPDWFRSNVDTIMQSIKQRDKEQGKYNNEKSLQKGSKKNLKRTLANMYAKLK